MLFHCGTSRATAGSFPSATLGRGRPPGSVPGSLNLKAGLSNTFAGTDKNTVAGTFPILGISSTKTPSKSGTSNLAPTVISFPDRGKDNVTGSPNVTFTLGNLIFGLSQLHFQAPPNTIIKLKMAIIRPAL